MSIKALVKQGLQTVSKYSPELLIALGIIGMGTSAVLAVKATEKAKKQIDEKKEELEVEELSKEETVKTVWKTYIPPVIAFTTSAICILGAHSIDLKRNAILAAGYKASETALLEYKSKVKEKLGEKKEKEIVDEIAQDKLKAHPVPIDSYIHQTGYGNTLCYDPCIDRYFRCSKQAIEKVAVALSRRMIHEMYISLNDFYYELNLPRIDLGDDLGWNTDDGDIQPYYSSMIASNDEPCLVISYLVKPRVDYRSLY